MERKMKHLLLVLGNSIGVVATIIVNALAIILPLNGKTTSELSDAIPNLFVPAGITFSIWSVIYLFLIVFMIYQILELTKKEKGDMMPIYKIGPWFMIACLANIVWIFLWQYEYVYFSLLAMLLLFASLLVMYLKLNIGLASVPRKEKLVVHVTISIYLGWITVATIANVTAVLVKVNVGGLFFSQDVWAIVAIAVAEVITILMVLRRKDAAYSLVIIWALLGIIIKRQSSEPVYTNIVVAAGIGIVLILIMMLAKTVPAIYKKETN